MKIGKDQRSLMDLPWSEGRVAVRVALAAWAADAEASEDWETATYLREMCYRAGAVPESVFRRWADLGSTGL